MINFNPKSKYRACTSIFILLCLMHLVDVDAQKISAIYPNPGTIFDDKIHRIDIFLPADSLNSLFDPANVWSNIKYKANFIFDLKDTLSNIGVKIKGNTSRDKLKKSIRIDFDAFVKQDFQGLKKLNVNGNLNDPSMMREWLSAQVMQQAQLPAARVNLIELYINGENYGLRACAEFIDKTFIKSRFGNDDGNLYKCTWPADLGWLGNDINKYKKLINPSPINERAYELKTNEAKDDYTNLFSFIQTINQSPADSIEKKFSRIFQIDRYLKILAAEVLIGHWDNYYANKNNYFLYFNTASQRFEYIPYDMDNTFGIHWGFPDINKRNIHKWESRNSSAPLTKKILSIPAFKRQYEFYIRELINGVFSKAILFSKIDDIRIKLRPIIIQDPFFNGRWQSDYGFTIDNWIQSADAAAGDHVAFGIKPYIEQRNSSALSQMLYSKNEEQFVKKATVFPNPINSDVLYFSSLLPIRHISIFDITGTIRMDSNYNNDAHFQKIDMQKLPSGKYHVIIDFDNAKEQHELIRIK